MKSKHICFRWRDWNNFQQSFRAHVYPPCGIVLKDPNCCYTPWAIDDSGFKIRRGLSTNYKFTCEFRLVEFRPFHWLRKSLFQILLFATPQQETKNNTVLCNIITLPKLHEFSSIKDKTENQSLETRVQLVLKCNKSPFNTVEPKAHCCHLTDNISLYKPVEQTTSSNMLHPMCF